MCGIVGYFGKREAAPLLVEGLSKLEYRGYDSAGVALINNGINVRKCKGRLDNFREKLNKNPIIGNIGIGHTRWATHGEPSDVNSHPHTNEKCYYQRCSQWNYRKLYEIKRMVIIKRIYFLSETDTEVIPNLSRLLLRRRFIRSCNESYF